MTFPLLLHAIRSGDDGHAGRASSGVSPHALERSLETDGARAELSDAEQALVAQIRAGDETAMLALFQQYYARLCDFTLTYVSDAALAEDVVSDVFLSVWRSRATWRVTGTIRAYLFSAARYRALNVERDRKRRVSRHASAAASGDAPGMAEAAEISDGTTDDDSVERAVWAAIDALPERSRLVMTLRWRNAMPLTEIAVVLGTTEMAVRQLHKRALATLRQQLGPLVA